MELQQQQQQLISMEGIENSNFRALITKLINVMLALLAVVLVLVSTLANLIGPFLTTRLADHTLAEHKNAFRYGGMDLIGIDVFLEKITESGLPMLTPVVVSFCLEEIACNAIGY